MKFKQTIILLATIFIAASCRERYKNADPAPAETAYKTTGTVGGQSVSFAGGINGYSPSPMNDSSNNYVMYSYSLRTPNENDDHFKLVASSVFAGADSNDTNEMFDAVAPKSYELNQNTSNKVTYTFSYFKNGTEYSSKPGKSGNFEITSNKDLGEVTATDKNGKTYSSRYVEFNGKLTNVKLYDEKDNELVIENFEFNGKFGAIGDMKRKK